MIGNTNCTSVQHYVDDGRKQSAAVGGVGRPVVAAEPSQPSPQVAFPPQQRLFIRVVPAQAVPIAPPPPPPVPKR
jgi:hypothetical protein